MNAPADPHRLDYLDAVRAFALLLGIVFHASLSFVPVFIGWAVMDISTSPLITRFVLVSHSFRMELFFLLAGFFGHMTYHRKGAGQFLRSRLIRIVIPFIGGWFILKPLIISGWVMGAESMRGDVDILQGLQAGLASLGELPGGLLVGSHLWFLYYLMLCTGVTLAVRAAAGLSAHFHEFTRTWADRAVRWIARSRFALPVLALPTAACLWQMDNWGMDTPDKSLVPHWPVLAVYAGCFALGWLLHRQEELIARFSRLSAGQIALGLAAIAATVALSNYQSDMAHPHILWIRVGFVFSYALMMWSLVALTVGLFRRCLDKPSRVVRYVADSSYWLYLMHLPVVVWLQIAFAELPLHWSLKLAAVSLLTVGVSILLYDLCVRPTWIGAILNGRRRERGLFSGNWRAGDGTAPDRALQIPPTT